jgi:hypothetical protein
MEEKAIEEKQGQPIGKKKVYTSPTLTMYGKLTELTAGGSGVSKEASKNQTTRYT